MAPIANAAIIGVTIPVATHLDLVYWLQSAQAEPSTSSV
jgi:hypothetical protein